MEYYHRTICPACGEGMELIQTHRLELEPYLGSRPAPAPAAPIQPAI